MITVNSFFTGIFYQTAGAPLVAVTAWAVRVAVTAAEIGHAAKIAEVATVVAAITVPGSGAVSG